MKGIILAGGSGTRLYPLTMVTSKQLLPIYDKPMIYYPLSTLMLANIKDILIISTPEDLPRFKALLGDGSQYGINLSYEIQEKPEGLAQAFIIGKEFIGDSPVAMILGDNIFYGSGLREKLIRIREMKQGATIFGYRVKDPQRFGVVSFNDYGKVINITEKPNDPQSNYAITGLYFYDNNVVKMASQIKPSTRGELEITDLNNMYLEREELNVELLGRGYTWLDTGTHESLTSATNFVKHIQDHQSIKISSPEEIAYINGWIDAEELRNLSDKLIKTEYGKYLLDVANGNIKY